MITLLTTAFTFIKGVLPSNRLELTFSIIIALLLVGTTYHLTSTYYSSKLIRYQLEQKELQLNAEAESRRIANELQVKYQDQVRTTNNLYSSYNDVLNSLQSSGSDTTTSNHTGSSNIICSTVRNLPREVQERILSHYEEADHLRDYVISNQQWLQSVKEWNNNESN